MLSCVNIPLCLPALQVNINGNISPGMPFSSSTLQEVPTATISPYRMDVDTRTDNGGYIWYRLTNDSDLLDKAMSHVGSVYKLVTSFDYLLIATWDHVGYFQMQTDQVYTITVSVGITQCGCNNNVAIMQ